MHFFSGNIHRTLKWEEWCILLQNWWFFVVIQGTMIMNLKLGDQACWRFSRVGRFCCSRCLTKEGAKAREGPRRWRGSGQQYENHSWSSIHLCRFDSSSCSHSRRSSWQVSYPIFWTARCSVNFELFKTFPHQDVHFQDIDNTENCADKNSCHLLFIAIPSGQEGGEEMNLWSFGKWEDVKAEHKEITVGRLIVPKKSLEKWENLIST